MLTRSEVVEDKALSQEAHTRKNSADENDGAERPSTTILPGDRGLVHVHRYPRASSVECP